MIYLSALHWTTVTWRLETETESRGFQMRDLNSHFYYDKPQRSIMIRSLVKPNRPYTTHVMHAICHRCDSSLTLSDNSASRWSSNSDKILYVNMQRLKSKSCAKFQYGSHLSSKTGSSNISLWTEVSCWNLVGKWFLILDVRRHQTRKRN